MKRLLPDRYEALAFLTAFATLASQVLVHRMVSAKLLNNYAFLVISLTMLGFAASGALLTRFREWVAPRVESVLLGSAGLFALSLLLASFLFYRAPNAEAWATSRSGFILSFLYCVPLAMLYAVPFGFAGTILGILLSSSTLSSRRIYSFDLAGSALGAAAVVPAISALGVETSAFGLGAILMLGAWRFTRPSGRPVRVLAAVALATSTLAALAHERFLTMTYPASSFLGYTQTPGSGYVLERVEWDPVARIEVLKTPPPDPRTFPWPALIGGNPSFLHRFTRMLTQNNNANTYAIEYGGRPEDLQGIGETLYAAAYQATSVRNPEVLVIGVGGGFDILNALHFGCAHVTGVEINAATLRILTRIYRDYFKAWVDDPRVTLRGEEGRHFLSRDPRRYDVIQLSGVDSASGTPAAAHVFSENYLYTEEAFDTYLSCLSDDGMMNMMRTEHNPPREMLRALVSAVAALRRLGATRPAEHLVVLPARNGGFTAMLVKRRPFSPEEVRRVSAWASASPWFGVAAAPGMQLPPNVYQDFLSLGDARRERAFAWLYPFDVRPASDDRPFFFHFSYWSHLFSTDPLVRGSIPAMQYGLLLLLAITSLAVVLCVHLPLRYLLRGGFEVKGRRAWAVFFGGLGLGYLAVEVALLQRFGLFLGHPNHALSVVLASLLLASGLGALLSGPLVARLGLRYLSYAVSLLVLAEYLLVFPRLGSLISMPFVVRVVIVFTSILPLGFALGTLFPSALERLKSEAPEAAPWAWGLNGVFSVLAPVLAVAVSMTFGISALFLSAAPIYLVVGWASPRGAAGR